MNHIWKTYRKKPLIITARLAVSGEQIGTLEGTMTASEGDMIIRGIKGEEYPCKPDVFAKSYDLVE